MKRRTKILLCIALMLVATAFLTGVVNESRKLRQNVPGASSRLLTFGAGLFVSVLGFGLLVAYEFSHFVGDKAEMFFFNEGGEPVHDPDYEDAEKLWVNGQHIDAITHLREFLKREPRQIHAAIRIAEIYEKDLHNPLAAALEYEEILQKKLPPERWGWAAIHLVNLYSGPLDKVDAAMALLERIAREYPRTGAARKARERLGLPEPEPEPEPKPKPETVSAPPVPVEPKVTAEAAPAEEKVPEPPKSNLPRGFRPK